MGLRTNGVVTFPTCPHNSCQSSTRRYPVQLIADLMMRLTTFHCMYLLQPKAVVANCGRCSAHSPWHVPVPNSSGVLLKATGCVTLTT